MSIVNSGLDIHQMSKKRHSSYHSSILDAFLNLNLLTDSKIEEFVHEVKAKKLNQFELRQIAKRIISKTNEHEYSKFKLFKTLTDECKLKLSDIDQRNQWSWFLAPIIRTVKGWKTRAPEDDLINLFKFLLEVHSFSLEYNQIRDLAYFEYDNEKLLFTIVLNCSHLKEMAQRALLETI